ncbi:glycoside hydrolase family 3 N-terminal domain-containing protein [Bifidobacterium samirii]|uniref:Glycosyl hydrolase family 3 N terminal domain-containing protein n=1 Tax=Bifidobacterium samirii TaxID=2306974 RepID=A0A430FCN2_9BIFI|nr:glycoside hydrolase family 3 N-terminal domain-containing protein [Bifidobacterium samirii]RSX50604.1 Glycosyl hydrolase family 3 N terminal domain-containing protein [Bifidobacterium samirii]
MTQESPEHPESQTPDGAEPITDPRTTPLWDPTLPVNERVDWLLDEMTIDEKLGFLATTTPDLPRLGITRCWIGGEAAHGIEARHDQGANPTAPETTTSLPQPIGMAATWDAQLLEKAGEVVGKEARALWHRDPRGGLFRWAPTVDLERDPRWGRNEEGYGEDPHLTGAIAGAYIRGMQGGGPEETRDHLRISAALKHFFANNVEDARCTTSSTVDARNRREYYYEPFRRCIEHAGATSVMTAYNAVNGTVEMLDPRVDALLHGEYGLYGHVVSDGGAVSLVHDARHDTASHAETVARSLKAGVDCMTDDMDMVHAAAVEAWERGWIDESDVDRALRRSFTTKIRLGMYDATPANPFDAVSEDDVDSPHCRDVARRVAEESVVLLRNDGLLPLDCGDDGCGGRAADGCDAAAVCGSSDGAADAAVPVALVGPLADQWFQDWYGGEPPYRSTLRDGVRAVTGIDPLVDDGLDVVILRFGDRYAALETPAEPDGTTEPPVPHYALQPHAPRLVAVDDRAHATRFRLQDWGDGALTLRADGDGRYLSALDDGTIVAGKTIPYGWFVKEVFRIGDDGRLHVWSGIPVDLDADGRIAAIDGTDLSAQRIGVPQTAAIGSAGATDVDDSADVETARETVPAFAIETIEHGIARATALAARARTVIAAVGCCPVINGKEDADRPSTAFPADQRALVAAVHDANPRTVMALIANYPYDIDDEAARLPAIVHCATGGQAMGEALARVIYGLASPGGRLPMTWYGGRVDLGDKNDYDIIGTGRTYQWRRGDVLYPFGHGLTYAPFLYDGLNACVDGGVGAAGAAARPDDALGEAAGGSHGAIGTSEAATDGTDSTADRTLRVRVDIVNEGTRASDEVVQVYVRHPHERVAGAGAGGTALVVPPIAMPERRLVAFRREHAVEPGERRTIEFTIPREELRVYDVRKGGFHIPDGEYTIEAGASSGDIRATTTVRVAGEPPVMRRFDEWIPVDHWDRADGVALVAAAGRTAADEPLASLVAAGEACAATPREPSRSGVMRFDGFAPFPDGTVVRIAADSIDGDGAVQEMTLPLPEGETGFTMAIGDGDIVRAVRCEVC